MFPFDNGEYSRRPSGAAKLSDVAYAKIAGSVASGEYPVGGKLPTENELADLLSVSRPIIREALARLRDDGLVVSRRGSGTYVRRAPLAADRRLAPLSSIADMRQCLEFRISFESETAYHAASALTDDGKAHLVAALERLEEGVKNEEINVEDDYNFHLAVARATENRFFMSTMSAVRESVMTGMNITRNFAFLRTSDRLAELHQEHVDIFRAIEARDATAAKEKMRQHLENAMSRAFKGTLP